MEIEMDNIQGRLLLEESLSLNPYFHNSGYNEGSGRGYMRSSGWYNTGNGDNLQYYFSTIYLKYDFNMIYGRI